MNPIYDIYEEIDRYLYHQLSESELAAFNKKLLTDADFKSIVDAQKIANEVIIDQEMIKLKARMSKEMNADNTGSGPWGKIIIFSALVVTSAALYMYSQSSSSDSEDNKNIAVTAITQTNTATKEHQKETTVTPNDKYKTTTQKSKATVDMEQKITDALPVVEVQKESVLSIKETVHSSVIRPQKEEIKQAIQAADQIAKVNCETLHISAEVIVDYGFEADGEATIIIKSLSVKGSLAPYTYAIDQSAFESAPRFDGIKDGVYHVRVKDHNGCIAQVKKEVIVKTPVKEIDDAFAPAYGERWKFPVKANKEATISIFNKAGTPVYITTLSGGYPEEWDGRNNSGVELESGNYYFVIQYSSHEILKGYISIVK